jgi:hypothetical protein
MMVFDEWFNDVSVAYIITSNAKQKYFASWMNALNDIFLFVKQDWRPYVFIVNDAKIEINNLR